jgi:tRNA dimethylallyltransferase
VTSPSAVAVAITGPTTSGKSALAVEFARAVGGEVISMDSRQIYRGMDIGTDKVSSAVRAETPHHGLDIRGPDERYSAGEYARDARRWISEIRARERVPLLVGGTGFFLKAIHQPLFSEPPMDEARRSALQTYLGARGPAMQREWLVRLDPDAASRSAVGGEHRVLRALEVALLTGRPLGWWHEHAPPVELPVPLLIFLLEMPKDRLFQQIDARVGRMIESGLVDEVSALLAAGYTDEAPGMTGTGYREVSSFLRGECSLEAAADEIRRVTRGYAKRQLTWFRHQLPSDRTLRLDATQPRDVLLEVMITEWKARAVGASGEGVR